MRLSLRIPLTLAIIVVVTGIIAIVKISTRGGTIPTTYLVAWIVVSIILIGITPWSWLRGR
jgi:hypothetical protein